MSIVWAVGAEATGVVTPANNGLNGTLEFYVNQPTKQVELVTIRVIGEPEDHDYSVSSPLGIVDRPVDRPPVIEVDCPPNGGPPPITNGVPEPSAMVMFISGLIVVGVGKKFKSWVK
jgi:hypothetical protein